MKMALRKREPVEQGKLLEHLSRASGSIAGWTEQLPGYVSAPHIYKSQHLSKWIQE